MSDKPADICLLLEGTYPYVAGGVSTWVHDLLTAQSHLTFHLVLLLAPSTERTIRYTVPDNVIGMTEIIIQQLPVGAAKIPKAKRFFNQLEKPLEDLFTQARLEDLQKLLDLLETAPVPLGQQLLLDSEAAWEMLLRMYERDHPNSSFLDYFWSWRALLGGLFSILLPPLPNARLYHAISTGYAGLLLARAHLQKKVPTLITEHGIYTNERRIEIVTADWLYEESSMKRLAIEKTSRDLRDMWIDTFTAFSRLCYAASCEIITLYGGNQSFQLADGADAKKMKVIPNGIDYNRFAAIKRNDDHPPTVALIGRVVPIKDIKTYIRACAHLTKLIPNLQALICGPTDEDPLYEQECREMVRYLQLEEVVTFTGPVKLETVLPRIDVNVLTSISEAQPLVILEVGAAGIPTIATDVGACREMIYGPEDETPKLEPGGEIVPLSDPETTARAIATLLTNPTLCKLQGQEMQQRVRYFYHKSDLNLTYARLYQSHLQPQEVR
ncbi:GT4 family glycosyltransferase PelF [Magnetococcus sp. PR-3]|uniref:GT4 family glycosyltransferase PelF n=1 Tax=Magnetococcus sp. PR-3 TaxID=3120355 RepID=UPI002FCE318D